MVSLSFSIAIDGWKDWWQCSLRNVSMDMISCSKKEASREVVAVWNKRSQLQRWLAMILYVCCLTSVACVLGYDLSTSFTWDPGSV